MNLQLIADKQEEIPPISTSAANAHALRGAAKGARPLEVLIPEKSLTPPLLSPLRHCSQHIVRVTACLDNLLYHHLILLDQPRRGWNNNLFTIGSHLAGGRLGKAHRSFACGHSSKFPILTKEGY